jgi:hypothetical protein
MTRLAVALRSRCYGSEETGSMCCTLCQQTGLERASGPSVSTELEVPGRRLSRGAQDIRNSWVASPSMVSVSGSMTTW